MKLAIVAALVASASAFTAPKIEVPAVSFQLAVEGGVGVG